MTMNRCRFESPQDIENIKPSKGLEDLEDLEDLDDLDAVAYLLLKKTHPHFFDVEHVRDFGVIVTFISRGKKICYFRIPKSLWSEDTFKKFLDLVPCREVKESSKDDVELAKRFIETGAFPNIYIEPGVEENYAIKKLAAIAKAWRDAWQDRWKELF